MMQTLIGFIKKEFKQTLSDPRMLFILFLAPCLQMTLFGLALTTETRNARMAAMIHNNDSTLQSIYQHALASSFFTAVHPKTFDSYGLLRSGEAQAVLVSKPEGVKRQMARAAGEIQLLLDASNVIRAQSIERYLTTIAAATLESPATPQLDFDLRLLYNPGMRSTLYMVPGVMGIIICMTTIILTSMAITREKEIGTIETILSAPVSRSEIILGKTIPYVILGMLNVPLILSVAVFFFDVPLVGPVLTLGFASFIFVITTVFVGILISTVARTQQQAMMGGFIFLFPAILLSGLMFPIENMPWILKVVSYGNPLTYFMELIRNIMLKGGDPTVVFRDLTFLAGMALILGVISVQRFKTTL
jgi:ABC-2 type transport system permease protein